MDPKLGFGRSWLALGLGRELKELSAPRHPVVQLDGILELVDPLLTVNQGISKCCIVANFPRFNIRDDRVQDPWFGCIQVHHVRPQRSRLKRQVQCFPKKVQEDEEA